MNSQFPSLEESSRVDGRALFLCQGWPALLAEEQEGDSWDEDLLKYMSHLNLVYYSHI